MIRILLRLGLLTTIFSAAALADDSTATRPAIYVNHAGLSKLGWQLACVGSTFQDRSTFDMIDVLHSMNFHHIELSTGQFDPADIPASDALVAKLKSVHMDIVSIGIVNPGKTEAEARTIFDLGRRLKIKTIVADPADESLEMLDKLANEYRINLAIVNLAKPGNHWDPDALLDFLPVDPHESEFAPMSPHGAASGISPVQAAKKLAGHILEVRLGDFENSDPADVLDELKAGKFKGICAVGCPNQPADALMERFTSSINAFSKIVRDLSGLR